MAVSILYKESAESKIYKFGMKTDGTAAMKDLLGGKGANLAEMASLGFPVPSGFTIPCTYSVRFNEIAGDPVKLVAFQGTLWEKVQRGLKYLQDTFGYMPLVSVRSGARVSMPGMLDTILNVGLTTETLPYWTKKLGQKAALDSYRRLIQMYASVAMGVDMKWFEDILTKYKTEHKIKSDADLTAELLARIVGKYLETVKKISGYDFPDTLDAQLKGAIGAVFRSWNNERAVSYRKIYGIPNFWGTAVNIQAMVFGNLNNKSATGVIFTRDPSTGVNVPTGEFLINAQGEDVVSGARTPLSISEIGPEMGMSIGNELFATLLKLENHYKDMQDVEFTIQDGKLLILQTRNGKRSPLAAFRIAHDLAEKGIISKEQAVSRVTQAQLLSAMSDTIDPAFNVKPTFTGIAAGGGVVTGVPVFTAADAVNCTEACILVRKETDPNDIDGMNASVGILTAIGGLTSHAAVVARGMNKACVVGVTALSIPDAQKKWAGGKITIDGSTGRVWVGLDVPVITADDNSVVKALVSWAAGSGVVERVTFSVKDTVEEVRDHAASLVGRVHVDTATFDASEKSNVAALMTALGDGLEKSVAETIYVDTSLLFKHLSKSDYVFNWMFGSVGVTTSKEKLKAMANWKTGVMNRVILRKADEDDSELVTKLLAKGAKIAGKITTFADLLVAGGPMEIDEEVIKSVFGGGAALDAAKKLVEQSTGKKFGGTSLVPVYWYDFLNQKGV